MHTTHPQHHAHPDAAVAPQPAATAFPGPTRAAVQVEHAVKIYGDHRAVGADTAVTALADVTITFPTARFTAIMGPSGSGKSTLLHCAAGLDSLTSGRVLIDDVDLGSLSDKDLTLLRRSKVGFVFQAFNLVPTLTAEENVLLPFTLAGRSVGPRSEERAWFDFVVDTVGLRERLGHRPTELSGGQQQRVAVARALVTRPTVVFADEPTGNLDSRSGAEVLGLLRRATDTAGQTVVMVTHDPMAAAHADEVVLLADGRIVDRIQRPTAAVVLDRLKALGD